jgi:site-specific DNA-methyltransferase (adenine-specific)
MPSVRLMLGDCLERMGEIEAGSVAAVICDLPYGSTACKWDQVIPLAPLWAHYRRLLKPSGVVVLTATQPFTTDLIVSNRGWFKYCWVWDRVNKYTGHLNARKRPMRRHEDVVIFAPGRHIYHPQRRRGVPYRVTAPAGSSPQAYGAYHVPRTRGADGTRAMPGSIIRIKGFDKKGVHPTQKPVALGAYLIRTYTNPGETVLDNTCGSGSFGVAAIEEGRSFIGIEKDPDYFAVAERRIAAAQAEMPLFPATA